MSVNLHPDRQTLAVVLESLPFGLMLVDGHGRLHYVNLRARRLLGRCDTAVPMDDCWRLLDRAGAVDAAGIARLQRPDGGPVRAVMGSGREILLVRTPVSSPFLAHKDAFLLLLLDITERLWQGMQEARRQRYQAMEEMAGRLTDTVRNQLGGIELWASLLRRDLADDAERGPVVERILAAVRELDAALGHGGAWPGLERAAKSLWPVKAWLKEALTLFQHRYGDRHHRFRLTCSLQDHQVHADRRLLDVLLANVVQNAVDAMPAGGTIDIDARLHGGAGMTYYAIAVADQGEGIAPQDQERVFDPFYSTRPGRNGMGLPIVHRIAELHGGMVRLESEAGRGTVLRLLLPAPAVVGIPVED